jgi:hypothetical protein
MFRKLGGHFLVTILGNYKISIAKSSYQKFGDQIFSALFEKFQWFDGQWFNLFH